MKVADGGKDRPTLILNPPLDDIARRTFDMAVNGKSGIEITRALNDEGIPTTTGKPWPKTTLHRLLSNEVYMGTLVWGQNAKTGPSRSASTMPFPPS